MSRHESDMHRRMRMYRDLLLEARSHPYHIEGMAHLSEREWFMYWRRRVADVLNEGMEEFEERGQFEIGAALRDKREGGR